MTTQVQDITWFKQQFGTIIETTVVGTPFTTDLLTAIAMQETNYIWRELYQNMSVADVLKNCVGDTLDAPQGRGAFPLDQSDLLTHPNGNQMFNIARKALESVGQFIPELGRDATRFDDAFCHGFGIFQYDIQFFEHENPSFFLEKRWYEFDQCLKLAIQELSRALETAYGDPTKKTLTDEEMVYVAIAYNQGSVDVNGGFDQGHFDGDMFYGEHIWEYLKVAKSVEVAPAAANLIETDPNSVGSVSAWQHLLNACGYIPVLRITGAFPLDAATVDTTKRFQKNLGLPETGSVDLATWRAGLKHPKLPDFSAVTPTIGRIGIPLKGSHVIDYVRQPNAITCQSACIAQVLGKGSESEVLEIRADLESKGIPGDPSVMGDYLKDKVIAYRFLVDGSLTDAKNAIDDGCVVITHGWFTESGHTITLVGYEPDPITLSYRFIVDDPFGEFSFPNAVHFNTDSGNDVRYSSYGIYAYCVASSSYFDATEIYASKALQSSEQGAWMHIIKN